VTQLLLFSSFSKTTHVYSNDVERCKMLISSAFMSEIFDGRFSYDAVRLFVFFGAGRLWSGVSTRGDVDCRSHQQLFPARYVTFRYVSCSLHLFRTPLRPCTDGTVSPYTASSNGASRIALRGRRKQAIQFACHCDVAVQCFCLCSPIV